MSLERKPTTTFLDHKIATMEDIILLGTFMHELRMNKTMLDTNNAVYGEVMADEIGLKRQAQDMSEVTEYVKHF